MRRGTGSRTLERFHATAECGTCHRERPGITSIETRPWENPAERRYHFCDECLARVVERPLDEVLADLLGG